MAQPIVSPENLNQAVEEIKEHIDSKQDTYIYTVISRRSVEQKHKQRIYLAVNPELDISQCTLQIARRNYIKDSVDIEGSKKYLKRHCGWHQVWAIPQKEKIPLFRKMILKPEPWCEYNGKLLYEITWEGYDCLWDWINETDEEVTNTGYSHRDETIFDCYWDEELQEMVCPEAPLVPVTFARMLSNHKNGIALVKDGRIISNYARFGVSLNDQSGKYMLYR